MSAGKSVLAMEGGVEPPSIASPAVPTDAGADSGAPRAPGSDESNDATVEEPDLTKLGEVLESPAARSVGITILAALAILYTLYFARAFVLPIVFAVLLYFLLAGGDLFLQKLIKVLPRFRDKKRAVEIARETEASISTYLFTVAIVNIAEGVIVAGALYLLGMPNAILWGVLTIFLEFIPYIGAAAMVAILALAGLTTFESAGHAMLIPATYLLINIVQAYFVSPLLMGHRLTLNPVAIFVGLALWFFLWGIPGAFLAVPLLAAFKIICDHIEPLAAVGEFLGRREEVR